MMILAMVQGLAWSLFGLSLGWGTLKLVADVEHIKGVVEIQAKPRNVSLRRRPEGDSMKHSEYTLEKSQRRWRIAGVVIMLMAVAMAASTWQVNQAQHRQTECQAQYNKDFSNVLIQRSKYADQDRADLITMINGAITGPTQQARLTAVQKYLADAAENDKLRAQNPLPKLDDRNC